MRITGDHELKSVRIRVTLSFMFNKLKGGDLMSSDFLGTKGPMLKARVSEQPSRER